MVKARKKPASAKGAVLLMVLTVMFVLIFMLAGTMAVVYSAHNRALAKYEESQGYYSARSVLDIYCDDLLTDDTTQITGSTAYYYDEDGSVKDTYSVKGSDGLLTYGRQLEFDLYKLNVDTSNKYYQADYNSFLETYGLSDSYSSQKLFEAMVNDDGTAFSNSNAVENQYRTESTYGDTYTYTIEASDLEGYGTGYGKVIDQGSAVTIKVELLSRIYDIGNNTIDSTTSLSDVSSYVKDGSRAKDSFTVKVTASVVYDNNTYETAYVFNTKYVAPVNSTSAIQTVGGVAFGTSGINSNGGYSSLSTDTAKIDSGNLTGNVFSVGDIYIYNSGSYTITAGEGMITLGDMYYRNDYNLNSSGEGSYVYVGGTFNARSYVGVDYDLNVIADTFKYQADAKVRGNVYTKNFYTYCPGEAMGDESAWQQSGNGLTVTGKVYTENVYLSESNFTVTTDEAGNMYARLDKLTNNNSQVTSIKGDVYYSGDIYVYYTSGANLVWGTISDYLSAKGASYVDYNSYLSSMSSTINQEYYTEYDRYTASGSSIESNKDQRVFVMPDTKIYLPTMYSLYGNMYDESYFTEYGDFTADGTTYVDPYDGSSTYETLLTTAYSTTFKDDDIATLDSTFNPSTHKISASTPLTVTDGATYESGTYELSPTGDTNANVTLDTTHGDIIIQLTGGGNYCGNFEVIGSGSVYFLLPGDDTSPVSYGLGSTGGSFTLTYPKVNNINTDGTNYATKLNLGNSSYDLTPAPKVYFWGAGQSYITIYRNSYVAGYWDVPESYLILNSDLHGTTAGGYDVNGMSFSEAAWCFGAVICGAYSGSDYCSVEYINPNQDSKAANIPNFSWQGIAYTASGD